MDIVVFIVQVKAFRVEIVSIDITYPVHITQAPTEADLRGDDAILLVVIYQLPVKQVVVIQLSALQSPFEIKARAIVAWILHPTSSTQSFLDVEVTTCNYEYFGLWRKSIFLFPFCQISDVGKIAHLLTLLLFNGLLLMVRLAGTHFRLLTVLFLSFGCGRLLLLKFLIVHSFKHIILDGSHHVHPQLFLHLHSTRMYLLLSSLLLLLVL